MIVCGDQPIRRKDDAAALHFIGLDIDHGAFHGSFRRNICGIDGNGGVAVVPIDFRPAVFRQKAKGDEGAPVFDLRRRINRDALAVDGGSPAVDGQGNGHFFAEGENSLGMLLPMDRIAQRFQNAPNRHQHPVIFDKGGLVEGNGGIIQGDADGGCHGYIEKIGTE